MAGNSLRKRGDGNECTGADDFLDFSGGGAVVASEHGEHVSSDHLHLSAKSTVSNIHTREEEEMGEREGDEPEGKGADRERKRRLQVHTE